jgi:hypothetical protein
MSQFISTGTKQVLINNATLFPLKFWDTNYAPSTALLGTYMDVEGFGRFDINKLHKVVGNRGVAGTKQVDRLIAGGNFFYSASTPNGTIVKMKATLHSFSNESDFTRMGDPARELVVQLVVNTADTANTVLAKLYNAMIFQSFSYGNNLITVPSLTAILAAPYSATVVANKTITMTALDLTAIDQAKLVKIEFLGDDNVVSPYITYTQTVPSQVIGFAGRNEYYNLKSMFIDTADRMPYSIDRFTTPIKGDLYSSLAWSSYDNGINQNGGNGVVNGIAETSGNFEIFVNDSCLVTYQNPVVDFLNRATVLSTVDATKFVAPRFFDKTPLAPALIAAAAFKV